MNKDLEEMIQKALRKVNGKKANDLCKFIPSEGGGYIHHFTMKKMRNQKPEELSSLIKRFIVQVETPSRVNPKQRAARGSRKKKDIITLTRGDVERLLDISRKVGDKEMVAKLSPKRSLASVRRDLIKSIRAGQLNQELWHAYSETVSYQSLTATD